MAKQKTIKAKDCSPIEQSQNPDVFLDYAKKFSRNSVFHLSKNQKYELDLDEVPFAYYRNYTDKGVWTGRWIGTAHHEKNVLTIEPRFGNHSLFAMLEETFSCTIMNDNGAFKHTNSIDSVMRLLIPLIWGQKLSKANRYGIPHTTVDVIHKGTSVKGRLDVRKSIIPFFQTKEIISISREKKIDEPIAQIILQAYNCLKNKPWKFRTKLTKNAEYALNAFSSAQYPPRRITENDYQHIHYKTIYQSYKDVVDFSWKIISSQKFENTDGTKDSFTGFIDMAEVWEMFLRSLFKRKFPDWHVVSYEDSPITVYKENFWKRAIIPDIVLEKDDKIIVLDAKWKRMTGRKDDLDRSDFFQIHSYISYFKEQGKEVVAGGLLYTLDDAFPDKNISPPLWNSDCSSTTRFFIGGIKIPKDENQNAQDYKESFRENTNAFINRMKALISQ